MVDTLDLGFSTERCASSSLASPTKECYGIKRILLRFSREIVGTNTGGKKSRALELRTRKESLIRRILSKKKVSSRKLMMLSKVSNCRTYNFVSTFIRTGKIDAEIIGTRSGGWYVEMN